MKTKHLLASLAMGCAVVALVGCASTAPQMSESFLDDKILQRDTNATVALDELRYSNTNAVAKEDLRTLAESDDGQINVIEFSTQAPNHSELYPAFGDAEQINNSHFSWDQQEFDPQGLQLFSIRF
jgi:hypothetical protein